LTEQIYTIIGNKKIYFYSFFITFAIFITKKISMEKKTRGRKPLPDNEKRKEISIFVKAKYAPEAYLEIKRIERKYNFPNEKAGSTIAGMA
jgi:hypothetical protein